MNRPSLTVAVAIALATGLGITLYRAAPRFAAWAESGFESRVVSGTSGARIRWTRPTATNEWSRVELASATFPGNPPGGLGGGLGGLGGFNGWGGGLGGGIGGLGGGLGGLGGGLAGGGLGGGWNCGLGGCMPVTGPRAFPQPHEMPTDPSSVADEYPDAIDPSGNSGSNAFPEPDPSVFDEPQYDWPNWPR